MLLEVAFAAFRTGWRQYSANGLRWEMEEDSRTNSGRFPGDEGAGEVKKGDVVGATHSCEPKRADREPMPVASKAFRRMPVPRT